MASVNDGETTNSVQLMRNSILRSMVKNNFSTFNYQGIVKEKSYCQRNENLIQPNIEVEFLEKRYSSLSSSKPQLEKKNSEEVQLTSKIEEPKNLPLPDFETSISFEASGELVAMKNNVGTRDEHPIFDDTSSKIRNSDKNNLKLAISSKSHGIFEDCSTYNISCPDASPEFKNKEIFTNSIAGSVLGNSLESNCSYAVSKIASSSSDEPTFLCDTFFSHLVNNEEVQLQNPSHMMRQTSKPATEEDSKKSEDVKQGDKKNSKKIRRRHRKNHANDSVVYECPKCDVSYVIASKMSSDGVCFHCDMWTSQEPEFVKREKLLTWNTCRIC